MANDKPRSEEGHPSVLDRVIASVPQHYRDGVTRFADNVRNHLPPVLLEHRIDALERHLDARLAELEAKVDRILDRLEDR